VSPAVVDGGELEPAAAPRLEGAPARGLALDPIAAEGSTVQVAVTLG